MPTGAELVAAASAYLGTPYLWGGKSLAAGGLDCSGLVQIALHGAGIAAPRDTDMQRMELGTPVTVGTELYGLARGDLVFWPGHVGVMTDGEHLLHANAHHMRAALEPLVAAASRIRATGADIVDVRRLT